MNTFRGEPIILWFKNDLRLHDNRLIEAAFQSECPVLPVYVCDIRLLSNTKYGFNRMGAYRQKFLYECLLDTRNELRSRGSELFILEGIPEEILPRLAEESRARAVLCSDEFAFGERQIQHAVADGLPEYCRLERCEANNLIDSADLPFEIAGLPLVFADFRKEVEFRVPLPHPLPAPEFFPGLPENIGSISALSEFGFNPELPMLQADPRMAMEFRGGERAALARLEEYFWEKRCLASYKETRNGLIGADYSSKLSPWLATGALSARMVLSEIKRFEREVVANESTYWLFIELLWRDFFRLNALKHGARIFMRSGIRNRPSVAELRDHNFPAWRKGRTDDAFVNANMHELASTGWMSNRGRQNVASYLIHDLQGDWLAGAAWFEHMLIDYDPCSNYGNWMYIAGCGNDPRPTRKFDTARQQSMYDPNGHYVELWRGV